MSARTLGRVDFEKIPPRLERGMSVSEDVGPQRGVDCENLHRLEREQSTLCKAGMETSP